MSVMLQCSLSQPRLNRASLQLQPRRNVRAQAASVASDKAQNRAEIIKLGIELTNASYDIMNMPDLVDPKNPSDFLFKGIQFDGDTLISSRDGVLTVAYRGSTSGGDWRSNAELFKTIDAPGDDERRLVHQGFNKQCTELQSTIDDELKRRLDAKFKPKYLLITGHSLGGALAVIAAPCLSRLAKEYGLDTHVVTFGQPKCGNYEHAKRVDSLIEADTFTYTRVVHDQDLVPSVPFNWMGYRHVSGPWLHLKDDPADSLWVMSPWSAFREALHRLNGAITGDLGVSDHNSMWYTKGIMGLKEQLTQKVGAFTENERGLKNF